MRKIFTLFLLMVATVVANAGVQVYLSSKGIQTMTMGSDGVYTYDLGTVNAGEQFKLVVDGSWLGGGASYSLNTHYTYPTTDTGGNNTFSDDATDAVLYYNPENRACWYTGTKVMAHFYTIFHYPQGDKWDFAASEEISINSDGNYEFEVPADADMFFFSNGKMTGWSTAGTTRFCPVSGDTGIENGVYSYTAGSNGVWQKSVGQGCNVVINTSNNTLIVSGFPEEEPAASLYMIGSGIGTLTGWNPANTIEAANVSVNTATLPDFKGFAFYNQEVAASAYFSFVTIQGGNNDWSGISSYRYGPVGSDAVMSSVPEGTDSWSVDIYHNSDPKAISLPAGKYHIFVPSDLSKIIVFNADAETGVENVAVDTDAPAEYYNLSGVKVENPGTGIYIIRKGDKVFKAIVR